MYFGIYGEDEADNIDLSGNKPILIRINGSRVLKNDEKYSAILNLDIYDIVSLNNLTDEFYHQMLNTFFKLNDFLINIDFDEIIVHCAMGISRSPAIMICIARILSCYELEKEVKDNFKFYNKFIVDLFDSYPFIKKNINIRKIFFKGHFLSNRIDDEDVIFVNKNNDIIINFENEIKLKKIRIK